MSLMRRWFPSFDGSARVSPYLYVAPKRRWWPTLLTFAAGGACALALLGPSQKPAGIAVTEKAERPLVFQVRPGDAIPAKDLASPPPAVATESSGESHAKSTAAAIEARGAEPAETVQQPNAVAPTSAMASVDGASPRVPPETANRRDPRTATCGQALCRAIGSKVLGASSRGQKVAPLRGPA